MGTALGQKRKDSKLTGDRSIIAIVTEKCRKGSLSRSSVIPGEIENDGLRILTDVVPIRAFSRQSTSPPYYCHDGVQQGTVTAFAKIDGKLFAISCAHCLTGHDGDPYTTDAVSLFSFSNDSYIEVGKSAYAIKGPGHGSPGDFGFSDVGIFSVLDASFVSQISGLTEMEIRSNARLNESLYADSSHGRLTGKIDMVEGVFANLYADVVIKVDGRGTYGGDSGMLWRSTSGAGVGVHTYGSVEPPNEGSQYSLAMSTKRATKYLQVDFLDP